MDELKECPFCGSDMVMCMNLDDRCIHHPPDFQTYAVSCGKCYATVNNVGDDYKTAKEAIKAWNTRTPAPEGGRG